MKFQRDSEGAAVATGASEEIMLANFLQGDIQEDPVIGREVLEHIDRVADGRLQRYAFSGNAHELTIDPGQARIRLADDDEGPVEEVSLADLRQALVDWLDFVA